jgi:hypothetical protein
MPEHRSKPRAHSIESSPHGNAAADDAVKGQIKIVGQNDRVRDQQPNASGRDVAYHAFGAEGALQQDHTSLGALVPRDCSLLNYSALGCAAARDGIIRLESSQPQPSLGLQRIEPLDARILCAKGECNALERLNLKPFRFGVLGHSRSMPWKQGGSTYISPPAVLQELLVSCGKTR